MALILPIYGFNFAYFIGKLRLPWKSTDAYWKCTAKKSPHLLFVFFSAHVEEKQNRKLGKFCSTISLEM